MRAPETISSDPAWAVIQPWPMPSGPVRAQTRAHCSGVVAADPPASSLAE